MANISIKEVADIAGVSIATVSRCLNSPEKVNEKKRIKVQDAILQTGYSPNTLAQSVRRGKTNMVMVVLPSIGAPFFSDVVRGIHLAADHHGYSVLIKEALFNDMTADEIGALLVSRQVDGIMLIASMSPFGEDVLSSKSRKSIPIVVGCETVSAQLAHFPSVHIDNLAAGVDATNYLISLGHTRIAFIGGSHASLLTKDREFGYRSAMQNAKLAIDQRWLVEGEMTIPGARQVTRSLLNLENRPTAILCANDEMAFGVLHEIKAAGLHCPNDISVIGFDDIRYAEVADPPLTTVYQPGEEIGARTFYRLLKAIQSVQGLPDSELVPHKLIVRRSTAPAPQNA